MRGCARVEGNHSWSERMMCEWSERVMCEWSERRGLHATTNDVQEKRGFTRGVREWCTSGVRE